MQKIKADRFAKTIRSVEPWVDEVVVIDSGSTDDTITIAQNAHARVISQSWLGFGAQKRFAEEQCHHEWVLNLDADEVVPTDLQTKIIGLFHAGVPKHTAYGIRHADPRHLAGTDQTADLGSGSLVRSSL